MSPRTLLRITGGMVAAGLGVLPLAVVAPAHAGQVNVTIGIQGSGFVRIVEGSLEDGGSTTCDQSQNLDHRVTLTCARVRNEEPFEAWVWLRPSVAYSPPYWDFVQWQGCDQIRERNGVNECGVGSDAFGTNGKFPVAVFRDTQAPTVSALDATQTPNAQGGFTFTWSTDGAVRSECRLDTGAWSTCSSGHSLSLAEGPHTLSVRAEDPSGNLSNVAVVDVRSVDTLLFGRPPQLTNSRTAEFVYSTGAGTSYDCALDGISVACTASGSVRFDNLGDGTHVFVVGARAGIWTDGLPVRWTWTVDAVAPTTSITGGPGNGVVLPSTSATFTLGSDDPAARLACTLDRTVRTCTTGRHVVTGLTPGTHVFTALATDPAGNSDPSAAERIWTVPTPARSLTRSTGWRLRTVSSAYDRRVLATTRKGAAVATTVRNVRRVSLVASGSTTAGTVRVYAGSRLIKTISLRTTRSVTKRVIPVVHFKSPWSGKIRVVVASSGRTVRLEGLAAPTR